MTDTPCKDCCFAEYEDVTQVGCSRGRIRKYKDAGTNILEAYDEDKEFFVIKDRICPFYRDEKWFSRFEGKSDPSMEKMLSFETKLSFHLIILLNKESTIEDIDKTIKSIYDCDCESKPIQVTLLKPTSNTELKPKKIRDYFKKDTSINWRMENLVVKMDDNRAIHMVQKTLKSQYYVTCKAGFEFPKRYLNTINDSVIEDLLQFGLIEIEEGSEEGVVVPTQVHEYWYFHGDPQKSIPENVKEYQCENKKEKVVVQFKSL